MTSFTLDLLFHAEPGGTCTTYTVSVRGNECGIFYGLLVSTSGVAWVSMLADDKIAHLDVPTGHFLSYLIPESGCLLPGLVMDANQNLWFTWIDRRGKLHPARSLSQ